MRISCKLEQGRSAPLPPPLLLLLRRRRRLRWRLALWRVWDGGNSAQTDEAAAELQVVEPAAFDGFGERSQALTYASPTRCLSP